METVMVEKQVLKNFVVDLEKLLSDFEHMLDVSLEMKAEDRMHEMKTGKVRSLNEEDYQKFIKKMGIK